MFIITSVMKPLTLLFLMAAQAAWANDYEINLSPLLFDEEFGYTGSVTVRNTSKEFARNVWISLRLYQGENVQRVFFESPFCFAKIGNKRGSVLSAHYEKFKENTISFIVPELGPQQEFYFDIEWPDKIPLIYGFVSVEDDNGRYGEDHWPQENLPDAIYDLIINERASMMRIQIYSDYGCLVSTY